MVSSATHLLETSVLTRLHRPTVRAAVQPFIDAVSLARCVMSDLELGFSASTAGEWDAIQALTAAFEVVLITDQVTGRAKAVQRMFADCGLKGRKVPDLLIAAAAELNGLDVVHYDRDFELIASVTAQPHTWVVPRGSVD